jgi:hypothetical protein
MTQSYDRQRIDFRGEFPEGLRCVDLNISRYENLPFESQITSGKIYLRWSSKWKCFTYYTLSRLKDESVT